MEVEHVQQDLVRIHAATALADETDVRQLRVPLLLDLHQQRAQTLQIAGESLVEEHRHGREPVAIEPVHRVERRHRQDAVRLRTDAHGRNGAPAADVSREVAARRFDVGFRKHRRHHRPHHVAERTGPERLVHRPRFDLVASAGVGNALRQRRRQAQELREPVAVTAQQWIGFHGERRLLAEADVERRVRVAVHIESGACVLGVVGRRSLRQQLEAGAAVHVILEQCFELLLAFRRRSRYPHAEDDDACETVGGLL